MISTPPDRKPTILYVANKSLPTNDYRIHYASKQSRYRFLFALPERSSGIDEADFVQVGFREGVSLVDAANFLGLAWLLFSRRKQLALTHYYSTKLTLVGPLLSAVFRIRSLITVTGLGRTFSASTGSRFGRWLYLRLMNHSARQCVRILFQNRGDMELLSRLLPQHASRFSYVGSTVDMPVMERDASPPTILRILLVSRLMPEKGIGDFLRVAEALAGASMKFVLIGPPSKGCADLETAVRKANERAIIEYLGELDPAQVQQEYAAAQVFYFPSVYGEGLPRVMLECGFAGLCPIAYDISSNLDLIAKDRGFLVSSGDCPAVISLLGRLAADPGMVRRNARAYQQFVTQDYAPLAYADRMDRAIQETLTSTGESGQLA